MNKMINISKSSMHYRLMDKLRLEPYRRKTICDYIKGIIISYFLWMFMIYLTVSTILLYGSIILYGLPIGLPVMVILGGVFVTVSSIITALVFSFVFLQDKYKDSTRNKNSNTNVFKEWYKAKKEKYCPFVTYTD